MNAKVFIRILLDFILFISILNGWWFIAMPVGFIGCWYEKYFIEIIIAGIAYDALFGMVRGMGVQGFMGTIVGVIIYITVVLFKKMVRR